MLWSGEGMKKKYFCIKCGKYIPEEEVEQHKIVPFTPFSSTVEKLHKDCGGRVWTEYTDCFNPEDIKE